MPTANRAHFFRLGEGSSSPLAANIARQPRCHDNDYPLWQGPCGEGPLGGITQSMLVRFLSCRERFRLKYVLGLEPPDRWSHHLGYGNMWHVCEERLAACLKVGDANNPVPRILNNALHPYCQELCRQYPLQQGEIARWYNVCCVQFPEYVRYWAEHPDVLNRTPLMQEQVFDVPYALPSRRVVRLRGKFDSVDHIIDDTSIQSGPDGGVYLQENKTKGDVDKVQIERQLKFDLQTMLYLIGLEGFRNQRMSLWDDPVPILGVRYNVVRRPLSGGRGSISPHKAKYTKTKVTPAETEAEFYERLRRDYIAADPDYWFFRVRAEISERDVRVFRDTCLDPLLETVCWWYDEVTETRKVGGYGQHIYGEPPPNYRTPFGVYSALEEGGATEYDHYLETGSEATLRRTETLFTELQ